MGRIQTLADQANLLPGGHPLRVFAFHALKPYGPFARAGNFAATKQTASWGRLFTEVGKLLAKKPDEYKLTAADVYACMNKANLYRDGFIFCSFGKKYSGKVLFGSHARRFLAKMSMRARLVKRRIDSHLTGTIIEEMRKYSKKNYTREFVDDHTAKRLQKKYNVKLMINEQPNLGMKNGWQTKVSRQLTVYGFGVSRRLRLDGATPERFRNLRSLATDVWNAKGQKNLTKQEIYDCAAKVGYKVKATKEQQHLAALLLRDLYLHRIVQTDSRYSMQVRLREAWLEIMLAKNKTTLTKSEIMQGFTVAQMRVSPAVPMFLNCLPDIELSAAHF